MIQRILKNKNSLGEILFHMNFAGKKTSLGKRKTKALLIGLFLAFGFLLYSSNVFALTPEEEKAAFENAAAATANGTLNLGNGNQTSATGGTDYYRQNGAIDTATGKKMYPPEKTEKCNLGDVECYFKAMLVGVLNLVGFIFAIAATLFAWVVDPANVSGDNGMLNKQAVKDVWIMVRDLLNMSFILVLLFAAFGTIFQMDKWNLKKVWLNILINALLVNFSFPIARFIIDISNVAFYYLLNNLFSPNGTTAVTGNTIFASFGAASHIGNILVPENYSAYSIAYLLAMIISLFIMGMTLVVIAGLFLVRLVALTMLVMFSPIGFVGYAIPSAGGYAKKWWDNLINYSFFAPIMVFVMAIALRISEAMGNENFGSFISNAQANSTASDASWISQMAFFFIPIVILWTGIGIAKKFGIEYAGLVTGTVEKWGKKIANIPWAGTKMAWRATGVPGGVKQAKDYYTKRGVRIPFTNRRVLGSDQTDDASAWLAGKVLRVPNAKDNNMLKRMDEAKKDLNISDMNTLDRNNLWNRGTGAQRLAVAMQNAEDGDLTDNQMAWVMQNYQGTAMAKKILSKAKDKNPEVAINHLFDANGNLDPNQVDKVINKIDPKDITESMANNQHFMELYVPKNKVGIDEFNKMSAPVQAAFRTTVNNLADNSRRDTTNRDNRNIMMQQLGITGALAQALQPNVVNGVDQNLANRIQIWNRMGKKHAENITDQTMRDHGVEMAANIDPKNVVEFVLALPLARRSEFMTRLRAANRPELRTVLRDRAISSY